MYNILGVTVGRIGIGGSMDNVFEELQKYIDKRVEEAVNERMEEFELQFMNPKKLTLKDFLK